MGIFSFYFSVYLEIFMERPSQLVLTYIANAMERACNGCHAASVAARLAAATEHRRMVVSQIRGVRKLYDTAYAAETAGGFLASCRACKAGGAQERKIAQISCGVWARAFEEKEVSVHVQV